MELEYAVLADIAAPRPDGKLDLHGVGWDTILATSVPTVHPRMDLVLRLRLSPLEVEDEHKVTVVLMDPDGRELVRLAQEIPPMDVQLRSQGADGLRNIGLGTLITFAQTAFLVFGPHALVITWDGTEVRRIPLHVSPLSAAA